MLHQHCHWVNPKWNLEDKTITITAPISIAIVRESTHLDMHVSVEDQSRPRPTNSDISALLLSPNDTHSPQTGSQQNLVSYRHPLVDYVNLLWKARADEIAE
jgi:hypothetical protein